MAPEKSIAIRLNVSRLNFLTLFFPVIYSSTNYLKPTVSYAAYSLHVSSVFFFFFHIYTHKRSCSQIYHNKQDNLSNTYMIRLLCRLENHPHLDLTEPPSLFPGYEFSSSFLFHRRNHFSFLDFPDW